MNMIFLSSFSTEDPLMADICVLASCLNAKGVNLLTNKDATEAGSCFKSALEILSRISSGTLYSLGDELVSSRTAKLHCTVPAPQMALSEAPETAPGHQKPCSTFVLGTPYHISYTAERDERTSYESVAMVSAVTMYNLAFSFHFRSCGCDRNMLHKASMLYKKSIHLMTSVAAYFDLSDIMNDALRNLAGVYCEVGEFREAQLVLNEKLLLDVQGAIDIEALFKLSFTAPTA